MDLGEVNYCAFRKQFEGILNKVKNLRNQIYVNAIYLRVLK